MIIIRLKLKAGCLNYTVSGVTLRHDRPGVTLLSVINMSQVYIYIHTIYTSSKFNETTRQQKGMSRIFICMINKKHLSGRNYCVRQATADQLAVLKTTCIF